MSKFTSQTAREAGRKSKRGPSKRLEPNIEEKMKLLYEDVLDDRQIEQVDIIFHLAAKARIQPSFKHPVEYFETNTNGTLNIAQYCVNNNIPLVYAGSSSHHSGKFKNPYTFTKDLSEETVELYQKLFNIQASTARFYNVYGPHHLKTGGYTTLIGRWEHLTENNQPLTIYGDGKKKRDFTHVDDIVDGVCKLINKSPLLSKNKKYKKINE